MMIKAFSITILASIFCALPLFAGSYEALDRTLSRVKNLNDFLNNAELKSQYKQNLDSYTKTKDFNCRGFDTNLHELEVLQVKVHGFSEKMLKANPAPTNFKIGEYSFNQITHPLNAVWLTKASEGCGQRACTDKDKILRDPYTTAMDGTSFFLVEKNGAFTGASVTVLPVKRGAERYDLVLENDPNKVLKTSELNTFLDKFKRQSKRTVLTVKTNSKGKAETYYSYEGEPFFALSEVKLEDPRAEQIFLAVGRRCGGGKGGEESKDSPTPEIAVGSAPAVGVAAGTGPGGNNNANNNSNSTNVTIENKNGVAETQKGELEKNSPKGKNLQALENAKSGASETKDSLGYAKNGGADAPPVYPIMPGSENGTTGNRAPTSVGPTGNRGAKSLAGGGGAGTHSGYDSPSADSSGFGGGSPLGGANTGNGFGNGGGLGSPSGKAGTTATPKGDSARAQLERPQENSPKKEFGNDSSKDKAENSNPGQDEKGISTANTPEKPKDEDKNRGSLASAATSSTADAFAAAKKDVEEAKKQFEAQQENSQKQRGVGSFGESNQTGAARELAASAPLEKHTEKLLDQLGKATKQEEKAALERGLAELLTKDHSNIDALDFIKKMKRDPRTSGSSKRVMDLMDDCLCLDCNGCCTDEQENLARKKCR